MFSIAAQNCSSLSACGLSTKMWVLITILAVLAIKGCASKSIPARTNRLGGRNRRGFPATGQDGFDLVVFHRGQPAQYIGQIFLGIDPATPTTLDDGVDDRAAPPGVGMADEQPSFAAHHRWAHVIFHKVIVIISELRAMWAVVKRTSPSPTPFIHFAVAAMSW